MNFTHYDLGQLKRGSVVVITLGGNAANVRLLDSTNLSNYRGGRRHRYIGGLAKQSPVRLQVPHDGRWHVAVDLQGLGGSARSSVRVEPPPPAPLPEIRTSPTARSLAQIVQNVDDVSPATGAISKSYDVFISHASEDKDDVVRDLAHGLQRHGLEVWYDEFALRIGDSLRRKIDVGLSTSRFGVVVLSPDFFSKNWSQYELDGLVTREMSGERQIILPVWHGVTRDDVMRFSPSLADKIALRTADSSVEEIAAEIADVVAAPSV
jgi:hypothetical protein